MYFRLDVDHRRQYQDRFERRASWHFALRDGWAVPLRTVLERDVEGVFVTSGPARGLSASREEVFRGVTC